MTKEQKLAELEARKLQALRNRNPKYRAFVKMVLAQIERERKVVLETEE